MKSSNAVRAYPQSIEAERALLCSLFLDNSKFTDVIEIISEDDFFDGKNSIIFRVLKELYANGVPFDFVTVSNAIKEKGLLDKVGPSYITSITEFLPAPANTEYYANIIKKKSVLRQLISMSTEIATMCYEEPEDIEDVLNIAEKRLFEVVSNRSTKYKSSEEASEDMLEFLSRLKERKSIITGIPSGFIDLDKMTNGFQEGDLIIVAGRPGMGKTSFALSIALNAALDYQKSVGIFSLEMSVRQLLLRMISSMSRVEMGKLRTGFFENDEWDRVVKTLDRLKYARIYMDDSSLLSSIDIRTKARKMKMEKNIDLLIVDYLQLIEGQSQITNRTQQISEISRSLKILAKELEIPVIALSQLNRAVESREDKRPTPADLRESGSIEQDADLVIFIYRDEVYNKNSPDKGKAEIIIAKHRNGPQGTIKLQFEGKLAAFRNLQDNEDYYASDSYSEKAEEDLDFEEHSEL
ncbi:replicative DNA helicase [Hippea sp. KM1]|uniref:replicative DNA helicase n=1 Tax=Hippea sp. KM1 TaxID=944481 RepID=UPI00046D6B66|nr:replicative DNA helicase [Hippea sp. KM1]